MVFCHSVRMHSVLTWNQHILSDEGRVSFSRKQRDLLMGYEFTTDQ